MSDNINLYDNIEVAKEFQEIVNEANKRENISKEEYDKLLKEIKESIEFMKKLDDIKIPEDVFVVFNEGDEQLIYENGEFFLTSVTVLNSKKEKITRKRAMELNIEYFLKYQVNPIINIQKKNELKKQEENRVISRRKVKAIDEKLSKDNIDEKLSKEEVINKEELKLRKKREMKREKERQMEITEGISRERGSR